MQNSSLIQKLRSSIKKQSALSVCISAMGRHQSSEWRKTSAMRSCSRAAESLSPLAMVRQSSLTRRVFLFFAGRENLRKTAALADPAQASRPGHLRGPVGPLIYTHRDAEVTDLVARGAAGWLTAAAPPSRRVAWSSALLAEAAWPTRAPPI